MGLRCNSRAALIVVAVGLALCAGFANAALSAELEADLQRAEALQEERKEPLDIVVTSHIISLSPAAQLANGDGDISTVGKSCHLVNQPFFEQLRQQGALHCRGLCW